MRLRNVHTKKVATFNSQQYYSEALQQLTGSDNHFDDDLWVFESEVNFNAKFDTIELSESLIKTVTNVKNFYVRLAKCLFLDAVAGKNSVGVYRAHYNQIFKIFAFLKLNNISAIDEGTLVSFIEFSLTTYIHGDKLRTKTSILSSSQFQLGFSIKSWFRTLRALNVEKDVILSDSFAYYKIDNALKRAVEKATQGALAYGDWISGGNLNSLTIDYGRYYIEHNANLYERYARYSQAIRYCQQNYQEILNAAGNKGSVKNFQSSINHFLSNKSVSDIPHSFRRKVSDTALSKIRSATREMLGDALSKLESINQLRTEVTERNLLDDFISSTEAQSDLDFLERLAELYAYLEFKELHRPILHLVNEELRLYQTARPLFDFKRCKKIVCSTLGVFHKKQRLKMLDNSDLKKIGLRLSHSKGATYLAEFNRTIEAAGVTLMVAAVGWRESEFGFSIGDVKLELNHDIRDQVAFPVRYYTHSLVPKTANDAKQYRELNLYIFRVLQQQALITQNLANEPVLYSFQRLQTKNPLKSAEMIKRSVRKNWQHFVLNYSQFREIDQFLREDGKSISIQDIESNAAAWRDAKTECLKLFESVLVSAYEIARSEYRRVDFFIRYDTRKNYLKKVIEGTANDETLEVMDAYLSESTLQRLLELSIDDVGPLLTEEITNEIMGSCLYPTPHAFRHMWAEAVFRRFSGNFGSFIRSSFKHVSNDMWQAYVVDKTNAQVLTAAKRSVISSLLHSYILKRGEDFAGGMSKYIDHIIGATSVKKVNQLNKVIDVLTEEVIDIQASTWGFCMLKKHGRKTAKCAEYGEPRRYLSEPAVCMHCTNFLATEQSITAIAVIAENSMKTLDVPDVPAPFRNAAQRSLKKAYQQLEKLNADPRLLIKIKEVCT